MPRIYGDLASWWPLFSRAGGLFSPPEEYVYEASFSGGVLMEAGPAAAPRLLELSYAVGSKAAHLKPYFSHASSKESK